MRSPFIQAESAIGLWPPSPELGFTYLKNGEEEAEYLSFLELEGRARAVAALLLIHGKPGDRVLLMFPAGLSFVEAFLGCLFAGMVAVPVAPPASPRRMSRMSAITADAGARLVLSGENLPGWKRANPFAGKLWQGITRLSIEGLEPVSCLAPQALETVEHRVVLLQYTSGSSGNPKGVAITHANLLANLSHIEPRPARGAASGAMVSWLPVYHDMGLIYGILHPFYVGRPCYLMSPAAFLQRPIRWLQAISRYRASHTAAPDFAYALCARETAAMDREGLDLSCLRLAYDGAEPVRAASLELFRDTFQPYGLRAEALCPAYGLAESTLKVTASEEHQPPTIRAFDGDALARGLVAVNPGGKQVRLVGCGPARVPIRIVDPETGLARHNHVGEIWVGGPSLAQGYFHSTEPFAVTLTGDETRYLATGDLGFLHQGELFVTGRLDDMLIFRGRNHYPQDIEYTAARAHPACKQGAGAAFAVEMAGEPCLVLVQELERTFVRQANLATVVTAIRESVSQLHGLRLAALVLLRPGACLKTTSGKVRRKACRSAFLEGGFDPIRNLSWPPQRGSGNAPELSLLALIEATPPADRPKTLRRELRDLIVEILGVEEQHLDPKGALVGYGLDSLSATRLVHRLERELGLVLSTGALLEGMGLDDLTALALQHKSATISRSPSELPKLAEPFPLSYNQRTLWSLYRLGNTGAAYHVPVAAKLSPAVDVPALEQAWVAVSQRHAALRTRYGEEDGIPFQEVLDDQAIDFKCVDAADWPWPVLLSRLEEEVARPFLLESEPVIRIRFFDRAKQSSVLLLNAHHIAVDLWSLALILEDWMLFYQGQRQDVQVARQPPAIHPARFVLRQKEETAGTPEALAWWKRKLEDVPPLDLPVARRTAGDPFRGGHFRFRLNQTLSAGLATLARESGSTLFNTLLASFKVLLFRYSGGQDLSVGIPSDGRARAELADLVGYLVNPLAIRNRLHAGASFLEFLGQVNRQTRDALSHSLPFAYLVEHLEPARVSDRHPFFQVMFAYNQSQLGQAFDGFVHGEPGSRINTWGQEWELLEVAGNSVQFELTLSMATIDGQLGAVFEYSHTFFEQATITRMADHFSCLLEGMVADPRQALASLPLMTQEQQRSLLEEWALPETPPEGGCLPRLLAEQAPAFLDRIALGCENTQISYGALLGQANGLAWRLRGRGVEAETVVGLCCRPGPEQAIGLLAILLAGGVLLPLDPALPAERLSWLAEDARAVLVLAEKRTATLLPFAQERLVILHGGETEGASPPLNLWPQNTAYVIYTSGSSGKPKGVAVSHDSLLHHCLAAKKLFGLSPSDRVLRFAGLSFDVALEEILPSWLAGSTLIMGEDPQTLSFKVFNNTLGQRRISLLNLPASFWFAWVEDALASGVPAATSLRMAVVGSELLLPAWLGPWRRFSAGAIDLVNAYGPTEATITATALPIPPDWGERKYVPIGHPPPGSAALVVDGQGRPLPMGLPGELLLAGRRLARGYYRRPGLTACSFIPNAYAGQPGERFYRTGDLVNRLDFGKGTTLVFLGRMDRQLKLRGYRIEPGEIESLLARHPSSGEVVVSVDRQAGQLLAFLTGPPSLSTELSELMATHLPRHMIPRLVFCASLPKTSGGKVDRGALAQMGGVPSRGPDRPLGAREELLAGIWCQLLNREHVNVDDNFFDLGGHSLLATRVVSRVRRLLGKELAVADVFAYPTLAGLAARTELADAGMSESIPPAPDGEPIPVSFAQRRIWILEQLDGPGAYHMPCALHLNGPICPRSLEAALEVVLERHEPLRTIFGQENDELVQLPQTGEIGNLTVLDLAACEAKRRDKKQAFLANEMALKPFNLTLSPPFRALLLRLESSRFCLLFAIHHIAADGWSTDIFFRELAACYNDLARSGVRPRLEPLPVRYRDYARWQRDRDWQPALAWWQQQLAGAPPEIDLPLDHARTSRLFRRGSSRELRLSPEFSTSFSTFCRGQGFTLYMGLLAALKIVLFRWTGQADLVLGTVNAGRKWVETEPLIGCFVNFLPLRTELSADWCGQDLLHHLRTLLLATEGHDDCPLEQIVATLNPQRNPGRTPLYNVSLLLQNFPFQPSFEGRVEAVVEPLDTENALMDLRFVARENASGLQVRLDFDRDLFEGESARLLLAAFAASLDLLVAEPRRRLDTFPLPEALSDLRRRRQTLVVTSSFTAEPLSSFFSFWMETLDLPLKICFAAYHQVFQTLLDETSPLATNSHGLNVVLLRAGDWECPRELLACLETAANRNGAPILVVLCPHPELDESAFAAALKTGIEGLPDVYLVTCADLADCYPVAEIHDGHALELGQIPYTRAFFGGLGSLIMRKLVCLTRPATKVIVVDCDNTLWDGICGESQVEVNETRSWFQEFLVEQTRAGKLLCLCSKNEEADVWDVFDRHPGMPLQRTHLVASRINWRPKSENLIALAGELNLDLSSFLFLDDNPLEIAEVRASCPRVTAICLPTRRLRRFVEHIWPLDQLSVTATDRSRTALYQQNKARLRLREKTVSYASFIAGLALETQILPLEPENVARAAQLTRRTSQFNSNPAAKSENEIEAWQAKGGWAFSARVSDRFGDYGLTGLAMGVFREGDLIAEVFLLSCRVLGRGVAHRLLAVLGELALKRGQDRVVIRFQASGRNRPVLDFLEREGEKEVDERGCFFSFGAETAAAIVFKPSGQEEPQETRTQNSSVPQAAVGDGSVWERIAGNLNEARQILSALSKRGGPQGGAYQAPQTALQEWLVARFGEILGVERPGINDDFFALGGNSITAVQMAARVRKAFEIDLSVRDIFEEPRVKNLAQRIARSSHEPAVEAPVYEEDSLPLSFTQERLWLMEKLGEGGTAWHLPLALRIQGPLLLDGFFRALQNTVNRHEPLRTIFLSSSQKSVARVLPSSPVAEQVIDLRALAGSRRLAEALRLARLASLKPFSLVHEPPFRAIPIILDASDHVLVLVWHHIACDGWSMDLLLKEVTGDYRKICREQALDEREPRLRYRDYAGRQRRRLATGGFESQLTYWRAKLKAPLTKLDLAVDQAPAVGPDTRANVAPLVLDGPLLTRIKALASARHVSDFMLLLAVFKVLMFRLSGTLDVIVGTPIAGRNRVEWEGLVGCFLNMLALRDRVEPTRSFALLLDQIRETTLDAYANADLPFESLVEALNPDREPGRHPIFDASFNLVNVSMGPLQMPGLRLDLLDLPEVAARYQLDLTAREEAGVLRFLFRGKYEVFSEARLACMAAQYKYLLEQFLDEPELGLDRVSLVPPAFRRLIDDFTAPMTAPHMEPITVTLADLAAREPGLPALDNGQTTMSYGLFNDRVCLLASQLHALGLQKGDVVAVEGNRCFGLIIALTGVLRSGALLLTLAPNLPRQRKALLLCESKARFLLTVGGGKRDFSVANLEIAPDSGLARDGPGRTSACLAQPRAGDKAYIFFTSGSTGKPKAVVGGHAGLAHFLAWERQHTGIARADRCSLLTGLSFDVVLRDLFLSLTAGATLCLAPEPLDPSEVLAWIVEQRISILHTTPSLLASWLGAKEERVCSVRWTLFAGEPLSADLVKRWRTHFPEGGQITNLYGPTEACLAQCFYQLPEIPAPATQPVGRSLSANQVLVLSGRKQLCGVGETGEIVMRPPYGCDGYLNTKDCCWTVNPFRDDPGDRVYPTGDLGRFKPDGNLEILGRIDDQFKIRGVRIQPAEITAELNRYPGVLESAVIKVEAGETLLAAFVTAEDPLSWSEMRTFLGLSLPHAMVPSLFQVLPRLPTTANGKLDRKALRRMAGELLKKHRQRDPVSKPRPTSSTEQLLAHIWADVLRVPTANPTDDFFKMGGHSLMAMRVDARIRKTFSVKLSMRTLFEATTLADQARAIDAQLGSGSSTEDPPGAGLADPEKPRLSPGQEQLWLHHLMSPDDPAYNVPISLRLSGPLDVQALEKAVVGILNRHHILRSGFRTGHDGQAYLVCLPAPHRPITVIEVGSREAQLAQAEARIPFFLEGGPAPLRLALLRIHRGEHLLLLTVHHIIADGWSMSLLVRELMFFYENHYGGKEPSIAELPFQYVDFAAWQRQRLSGSFLEEQRDWWERRLEDVPLSLDLPRDGHTSRAFRGARLVEELKGSLTRDVKELARNSGTTLFMTLESAFALYLGRISGSDRVPVGSTVAGRSHRDLESLVGFFMNTVVLANDLSGNPTFSELLGRVRSLAVDAFAHQELPFSQLMTAWQGTREGRAPRIQAFFNLLNQPLEILRLAGLEVVYQERAETGSKFEMTLYAQEWEGDLELVLQYDADLFEEARMRAMLAQYIFLLEQVTANPALPVSRYSIAPAGDSFLLPANIDLAFEPIAERVRHWATSRPDFPAVIGVERRWTYAQLFSESEMIAANLASFGLRRGAVVAVLGVRDGQLAALLLGILLAGGAFAIVEASLPQGVAVQRLEATAPWALVSMERDSSCFPEKINGEDLLRLNLAALREDHGRVLAPTLQADDLAHVVFTSGSTGLPSAVASGHGPLSRFLADYTHRFQLRDTDRFAMTSGLSHDPLLRDIFAPLWLGGTLFVADSEPGQQPELLLEMLARNNISVLHVVPSLARLLVEAAGGSQLGQLSHVFFGGARLYRVDLDHMAQMAPNAACINFYGASETPQAVAFQSGSTAPAGQENIPLGQGLGAASVFVCNRDGGLAGPGELGQIHVAGTGLARGYLGRPAATAASFLPDPFSTLSGARIYASGDLGRYLPNMSLVFVGRSDRQLSLRGTRVEPAEIEAVLLRHPDVVEAAVVVANTTVEDESILSAFVTGPPCAKGSESVAQEPEADFRAELEKLLGERLPAIMWPQWVRVLGRFPSKSNGKRDDGLLARLASNCHAKPEMTGTPPESPLQAGLLAIWLEILDRQGLGIHDDFFRLGGHSLTALRIAARVRQTLEIQLFPRDILRERTVARLAEKIEASRLALLSRDQFNHEEDDDEELLL